MKPFMKAHKKFFLTTIIGIVLIGILIAIPTGYEDALIYKGTERAVAQVIEVDNSMIKNSGLINSGEQMCVLKVEDGAYKGEEIEGVNFLSGSLEKDKIFQVGDKALITISEVDGRPLSFGKRVYFVSFICHIFSVICRKKWATSNLLLCNNNPYDMETISTSIFKWVQSSMDRNGNNCVFNWYYYFICLWI